MKFVNRFGFVTYRGKTRKSSKRNGDQFIRIANLRRVWSDLLLKRKRIAGASVVNEPIAPTDILFSAQWHELSYNNVEYTMQHSCCYNKGMTP